MTYAAIGAQADSEIATLSADLIRMEADKARDQATIDAQLDLIDEQRAKIFDLQRTVPDYGPVQISDIAELDLPDNLNYVPWKWKTGTYLQDVFKLLGTNDVLVLPEDEKPYLIDTSKGFRKGDGIHDIAMARCKAGIVGMGPGTAIDLGPSSFTQGPATGTSGNRNKLLEMWTAGGILANFVMHGRDLGGVAFDAVKGAAPNIRMERLLLHGAHRGTSAAPPNEAGGLVNHKAHGMVIRRCEVDCRDPQTGKPVGSSPIMLNVSNDCLIEDTYVHHALTGAPTAWSLKNLTTRRLRSEFNSSGFNHELVEGTVLHEDATFIIDRTGRTSNKGSHLSIGTNRTSAKYTVTLREWDAGYEGNPAAFFLQHFSKLYTPYTQKDTDIQVSQVARPKARPVPVLHGR
jgi:hypothetical protein